VKKIEIRMNRLRGGALDEGAGETGTEENQPVSQENK
jgi:hypothetical protein